MITDKLGMYGAAGLFLATALVAGWLAFGKANVTRDLKRTVMHVETICAATGTPYRLDERGRILPRDKWGVGCLAAVQRLVSDAATRATVALEAVTDHQAEQVVKATTDHRAAQADTTRRVRAKQKVEHANEAASGDRRDGAWLDGLNQLAGLRDEPEADLGSARSGDAEGDAAERSPDLPVETAGLPY